MADIPTPVIPHESYVRGLRNYVYDCVISDESWHSVRARWMQPQEIAWLESLVPEEMKAGKV